ncbi:MAG: CCXG family PEP-CTERM protein [Gammaproteobacteria bacterium]|nr:CCXG family PEP-CTERM protein [Gammaproteobacteria bacterium]
MILLSRPNLLLFTLLLGLLAPVQVLASWWHCDWTYRTELSLTSSGSSSSDAIRLTLAAADFDSAYAFTPDGADLRVIDADDATELNYFLEQWDVPGRTATVNVEVPTLSAVPSTVYVYYGNVTASGDSAVPSTSDAVTTFSTSGWRFHSRGSALDPTNEAEARSEFESLGDGNPAYGCTTLGTVLGRNNRNTFSGSRYDFGLYVESYFEVTTAGVWDFRMGSDYGRGGGLYVDGSALDERWNTDLWWALNYNNPDVLMGSVFLDNGYHRIEAIGFEGCCDGTVAVQFRFPGSSTWQDMSTSNLNLVTRDCPAGVVTPATIETNKPSYFSGHTFLDNGAGGSAHDSLRHPSEPGLAGSDVIATVVSTGSVRNAMSAADGSWSVCYLDEANNNEVLFQTPVPSSHLMVSEGPAGLNTDSPLNASVRFTASADTDYTDINFGFVEEPLLAGAQTVTVGAGQTGTLAHTYTATTTANVVLQISELEHDQPFAYSYTALADGDCDGIADLPAVPMSGAVSVVAGEQICFVIEVQGGSRVVSNSRLRLRVDADSNLQGISVTHSLSNEDLVNGELPTELALQKSVCNASRVACDITTGAGFTTNNDGAPAEELIYRVTYTSPVATLSDVSVFDEVPAFTTLKPLSISVVSEPAGVSCAVTQPTDQSTAGYVGAIEWQCQGPVQPTESGVVAFTVVVD